MAGVPARFNDAAVDRLVRFDAKFEALERDLLDASARRIHDFERRLEHEWIALRQLHEEPLKTFEQRTTVLAENCLNLVAESLALIRSQVPRDARALPVTESEMPAAHTAPASPRKVSGLVVALGVLAAFSAYAFWSVNRELRETRTRAAEAEERVTQLQQKVEAETRQAGGLVQRLTAEAMSSAARAERLANVLAASDVRAYPMRGLRTAAAAGGQTFFSASRGVALSGSNLPQLSADQTYQLWLVTPQGSIALGFAAPDAQGRLSGAFDIPSNLPGMVTGFMLSIEPAGGNAKLTGPIVLAS